MNTFTVSSPKHLTEVWADPEGVLALLRQQLRYAELQAEHPDVDMANLDGLDSTKNKCRIVINNNVYDDCELEGFTWKRDGYILFLSYDADYEADNTPRTLTWARLSLETGYPGITFGDKSLDIVGETWDFNAVMFKLFG